MNCYYCNSKLIWQNDIDIEDYELEKEVVCTTLICSNKECKTAIEVYKER